MKRSNSVVVVVVVPVHSALPSAHELISFTQCFRVLKNHDIIVVAPMGLDLSVYKKAVPGFITKFIAPGWQSSLLNYNKLKLSRYLYSLFNDYEFLLTYELDAFVFTDELDAWCRMPYDYIGAPWFKGHDRPTKELYGVGNSGFSLRRIGAVKKVLRKMYMYSIAHEKHNSNPVKDGLKSGLFKLLSAGRENYSIQRFTSLYEDHFLCEVAAKKNPGFRIAPIAEAMKFSFETNPELLYNMNEQKLPMGCHAWDRYNLDFWRPHIERFGYTL
jgi:hypothetical protein